MSDNVCKVGLIVDSDTHKTIETDILAIGYHPNIHNRTDEANLVVIIWPCVSWNEESNTAIINLKEKLKAAFVNDGHVEMVVIRDVELNHSTHGDAIDIEFPYDPELAAHLTTRTSIDWWSEYPL